MIESVFAITFVSAFAAVLFWHISEASAWRAERRDLLNRLMARKWEDYSVLAKEPQPNVGRPDLSTDAIEKLWYEAHAREAAEAA